MPSYSGIFTLQTQMQAVAAGTWTGIPIPIGSAYQGGFFAGQISTAGNGVADFNLVVGPVSSAQNTSLQFKTVDSGTDPSSVIDGPANSSTMNSATYPAAQFCEGLTIGGFSDWYLPAVNELEVCYYNLKPSTTSNSTSFGINANAVPARASNYTTSDPAQTSATNFRDSGSEDYALDEYWSSTQHAGYSAKTRYFGAGSGGNRYKTSNRHVRAIRRVAV
jgi:hypothetical protein